MAKKALIGISITMILFFCFAEECYSTTDLPMRHWAYEALEELAMLGMTDLIGLSTRPMSRMAVAHRTAAMVKKIQNEELHFSLLKDEMAINKAESLLYKLMDEFEDELISLDVDVVLKETELKKLFLFKLVDQIEKEMIYARLSESSTPNIKLDNRKGWVLEEGFNGRIGLQSRMSFKNMLGLSAEPVFYVSKDKTNITLDQAFLKLAYANVESGIGRTSLWWGPGRHGSLLISDNTRPLYLANVGSQKPFRVPYLEKIGLWNVNFFTAKLIEENNRAIKEPYLSGLKVEFSPHRRLNLGAGHTVMWGGEGVPDVSFADFLDMFFAKLGGGADEPENHIISFTGEWAVPGLNKFFPLADGMLLYCEVGAEDESGGLPTNLGVLAGFHMIDVLTIENLNFTLEYAKTDSAWYGHYKYLNGYTSRGNILGHHMGPDADDFHINLSKALSEQMRIDLMFDIERHGLSKSVVERKYEGGVSFEYRYQDNIAFKAGYEMEYFDGYNNVSGDTTENHVISLGGRLEF